MELHTKTIEELHELLVNKEVTVVELVESVFDRIDEVEELVDAFISFDKELALEEAKAIDERGVDPENMLDGIPIALKDNILTKDFKTTAASRMLADFRPDFDATVVKKLKEAGMIIIGKLNMDEFAMGGTSENSQVKETKNPWDLSKVPGGSSGGSAAGLAAGMFPASLGTDTGGSIRQPASYNSVVGMKPTYGTVSRFGVIAFSSSLDHVGPLTKTVKDNAVLLNAMSGKDERDGTSADLDLDYTEKIGQDIKGLKIGLPKEYFNDNIVDPDVLEVINNGVKKLEELGAELVEISLPDTPYGVQAYYAISTAEASSNLQRFDGIRYGYRTQDAETLDDLIVNSRTEGFGDEVKRRILIGGLVLSTEYYDRYFRKATKARTIIKQEYEEAFDQVDVIVGATSVSTAPKLGVEIDMDPVARYYGDILTTPANLAGLPALNIPAGFVDGMPVGMALTGNYYNEATLYQVAYAFEQATDYHKQFPKLEGGAQ